MLGSDKEHFRIKGLTYPGALLAPAFAAAVSPLPGAEELLVALPGAVCPPALPGPEMIGAGTPYVSRKLSTWQTGVPWVHQQHMGILITRSGVKEQPQGKGHDICTGAAGFCSRKAAVCTWQGSGGQGPQHCRARC